MGEEKKLFKVPFVSDEYGYIQVLAKDEEEAEELVMQGEFSQLDIIVKGGGMTVDGKVIPA